jgi:predicted nucleotidyltransferase
VRLSLFGSVARGDPTPQSDVDLIAKDGIRERANREAVLAF